MTNTLVANGLYTLGSLFVYENKQQCKLHVTALVHGSKLLIVPMICQIDCPLLHWRPW